MTSSTNSGPAKLHDFDLEDEKDDARENIRKARSLRSRGELRRSGQEFANQLLADPRIEAASCIATYVAVNGEPDTHHFINAMHNKGTTVLLPVLGAGLTRDWAQDTGPEDRQVMAPGLPPEPRTPHLGADALEAADVVIAPALSIDSSGTRLGQGGGWFDRALAHAKDDVVVIAMVFDEEFLDAQESPLPRADHDRQVHAVVTPTRWIDIEDDATSPNPVAS